MKAIIELPLKRPFELRVVEIPRMHLEHVGVNWHSGILEGDCYFHAVALRVRSEGQQWMFIKAELLENPLQAGVGVRHERIVMKAGEFRDSGQQWPTSQGFSFIPERLDRVHTRRFDRGEHAADNPDKAQDQCGCD